VAASPHRQWMQQAPQVVPAAAAATAAPALFGGQAAAVQPAKTGRQLLGYLPYWTKNTAKIPWQQLTQLAWFSAEVSASGTVSDTTGWGGTQALDLRQTAHLHGVQFLLTFTLFDTDGISAVLATTESRQKAIAAIVQKTVQGQGDGVNIDFEGLAKADKAKMVSFVAELRQALDAALPGSHLSLATPAVDWSGAWDYDALAQNSDGLMVMAYAIHYGGGNPGPQLPMASESPWSHKTLQWIVQDYLTYAGANNAGKVMIGLPLYGYTWPASSGLPGASKTASGKAIFFDAAQVKAKALGGWQYDAASQSTYVAEQTASGWNQTWCDSAQALSQRITYVGTTDMHLGLWALGYADTTPDVVQALANWQGTTVPGGEDTGGAADAGATADSTGTNDSVAAADAGADATGPDNVAEDVWIWDPSQLDGSGQPDSGGQPDNLASADVALADAGAPVARPQPAADGCTARPVGSSAASVVAGLVMVWMAAGRRRRSQWRQ
jgi:spore germination protein